MISIHGLDVLPETFAEGVRCTMTDFDSLLPDNSPFKWNAQDYGATLSDSTARFLMQSGIAPLVAAARGYQTLSDATQVDEFAKIHDFRRTTLRYQDLVKITKVESTVLPWHSALAGTGSWPSALQLRPAMRFENEQGLLTEYKIVKGSESIIDTHPATPSEWFVSSPKVLVTQGLVGGDAALTALLHDHGFGAELGVAPASQPGAVSRLSGLMLRVPQNDRLTILNLTGAHAWKGIRSWELGFTKRELVFALDTDPVSGSVAWTNLEGIWDLASSRGAGVSWIDLDLEVDSPAEVSNDASVGIRPSAGSKNSSGALSRFFAGGCTSIDLLRLRRFELPIRPARSRDDATDGEWRVTEDGNAVEQYGVHEAHSGPEWRTRTRLGGRVSAMETHRTPSNEEYQTGRFEAHVHSGPGNQVNPAPSIPVASKTCRIEVQWLTDDGTEMRVNVTGPSTLLMHPPATWDLHKAEIPGDLLLEPSWPPPEGMNWLRAVKRNKGIPPRKSVRWVTMGWVPVQGSPVCSFISGRTIISPNREDRDHTLAGVTDRVLPGASGFTLPPMNQDVMSPAWIRQVREDLTAVREAFVDSSPWTDGGVGAVVLAAGMRPAVPIDCTTSIWLQGPPGSAKSWTASMMLAFHQNGLHWTDKHLPASLKDTPTGSEQALAQSNIWVMDDLAPSPDPTANIVEQAKIGDIVRSVYNKSGKRRSSVVLEAREVFVPHALLVVTAENEHTISSVRDRTIIVELGLDALRSDQARDRMVNFRDHNRAPGRLLVASVQAYQYIATRDGWASMVEGLRGAAVEDAEVAEVQLPDSSMKGQYTEIAKQVLSRVKSKGKSNTRHVQMAVDLMLGCAPLQLLAEMVDDAEMTDLLRLDRADSLPARVASFAASSFRRQLETTPGEAFLEAVRNILAAGYAHVLNASETSLPPLPAVNVSGNRALGWQADGKGKLRPLGETIGELKTIKGGPTDAIMLNATNAFRLAQIHHRKTLPYGMSKSVYESVWGEELTHPEFSREAGHIDIKYKVKGVQHRGVPIHLNEILGEPVNEVLGAE